MITTTKVSATLSSWIFLLLGCKICSNNNNEIVAYGYSIHPSLSSRKGGKNNNGKYFAIETVLPPLQLLDSSSSSSTSVSSYQQNDNANEKDKMNTDTLTIPYSVSSNSNEQLQKHYYRRPLPVLYTNHPRMVLKWLSENLPSSGPCYLGFDVESAPSSVPWIRPNFCGPATVQLSTPDACLVIHMACGGSSRRSSQSCVPILEAVLCDDNIIKVGCSIDDDMIELSKFWYNNKKKRKVKSNTKTIPNNHHDHSKILDARSRFDIGKLFMKKGNPIGLKALTRIILGMDLVKKKQITISDWSKVPLSKEQLAYSARDAWVSAAIFEQLSILEPKHFSPIKVVKALRRHRQQKPLHGLSNIDDDGIRGKVVVARGEQSIKEIMDQREYKRRHRGRKERSQTHASANVTRVSSSYTESNSIIKITNLEGTPSPMKNKLSKIFLLSYNTTSTM